MTKQDVAASNVVRHLKEELRPSLNSIEAIAYCLEMSLPPGQLTAIHYMHRIQECVGQLLTLLDSAIDEAQAGQSRTNPASYEEPTTHIGDDRQL